MKKEKRDIRIVFGVFCIIFSVISVKLYPSFWFYGFIGLIAAILFFIAFMPLALRPLYQRWLKFAHILGRINTQILLFLVYVIVIIPAGIMMRVFGKDPMQRKMNSDISYWEKINLEGLNDKRRYEKLF